MAVDQRDYTLLTGADLQRCATGSITVCPAEIPVYHTQLMTCEGSLYFQSSDSVHLCRKDLLRHYRTPALIHHGSKWAYHFPEHRQVTFRCPQEEGQYSRKVSLVGGGLIHNASACRISTQEVRTIPVLSKTAERNLDAPLLFLPDSVPALPSHEVAKLVEDMPPETSELDFLRAAIRPALNNVGSQHLWSTRVLTQQGHPRPTTQLCRPTRHQVYDVLVYAIRCHNSAVWFMCTSFTVDM